MKTLILTLLASLVFHSVSHAEASIKTETAIFAGGCFWCMEPPFEKQDGVISAVSGYIGGTEKNPSYKNVARGLTGHTEAVEITYDPNKINYEKLLDIFWQQIDPTVDDRQFVDTGRQYRPGIFYIDETQRIAAERSRKATEALGLHGKPFKLEITQATTFWPAEDYHQDYYLKNPFRYNFYRFNSGRDQYLDKVWGDKRQYK